MLRDVIEYVRSNPPATIKQQKTLIICWDYLWPLSSKNGVFLILGVPWLLVVILPSWDPNIYFYTSSIFPWHNSLRTHVSYFLLLTIRFLDIKVYRGDFQGTPTLVRALRAQAKKIENKIWGFSRGTYQTTARRSVRCALCLHSFVAWSDQAQLDWLTHFPPFTAF